MDYNTLIDKLKDLTNITITQSSIAKVLQIPQSTIGNRISRGTHFKLEELFKLEKAYGLPIGVLSGVTAGADNSLEIDYYPEVFGSCGSGAFALSEIKEKISVPKSSFITFSEVKKYSVINAYGDSMQPFIQDRDKLIVEHWEGGQIIDNRVYVFCYAEEIFVKRLVKNIDQVIIKSDNTLYQPRCVEKQQLNDLYIIGQIVGLMRDMK